MADPISEELSDSEGVLARGERVHLRRLREADRGAWLELRRSSRAFLEPWEPEATRERDPYGDGGFDRAVSVEDAESAQRHAIVRASDGAIVGMVSVFQIYRGPFQNGVMGYWVGAAYARRGYGREGVLLCLGRAFGELGLHRVEANVIPENAASMALARSVGFREEGRSPRYLQIAGAWRDHVRFAMTREDWEARG